MPTQANITAKNAAGTNVTFEVVTAAQGDGTPATWQLTAASTVPAARPQATLTARWNENRTARKLIPVLVVPYAITDPSSGLLKVVEKIVFRGNEVTIPRNIPDAVTADAVAYWQSLQGSTLFRDSYLSGYAPA